MEARGRKQESSMRILVIDDEKDIKFILSDALKSKGYMVSNAGTIAEGKTVFRQFKPDLLFLDINLPDGESIKDISFFREQQPGLKICMISAQDDIKRVSKGQVDAYLSKPFSMSQIIEKTKELLG
jgi:DNA-binding response OmpR family regulator